MYWKMKITWNFDEIKVIKTDVVTSTLHFEF